MTLQLLEILQAYGEHEKVTVENVKEEIVIYTYCVNNTISINHNFLLDI